MFSQCKVAILNKAGLEPPLENEIRRWIQEWSRIWGAEEITRGLRIEFSTRMYRSLGRCYPARSLVRLHVGLLKHVQEGTTRYLQEVLCHEVAHLAAYRLHGLEIRPHGPEWKRLIRVAGYRPSTQLSVPIQSQRPHRRRRNRVFEHRCPVCQVFRHARKRMRSWRCMVCLRAGRPGRLSIFPLENRGGPTG